MTEKADKHASTPIDKSMDVDSIHAAVKPPDRSDMVDRPERLAAHIAVSIRKFRWTSLFSVDAMLVDLSIGGVKFRLPDRARMRVGDNAWVCLYSADNSVSGIRVKAVAKWVSDDGTVVGAEFSGVGKTERRAIERLIEHFKQIGRRGQ